jgi:NAD(P)-dependent dehydrogenase (short-subunit alcohol dehydrogenase family)
MAMLKGKVVLLTGASKGIGAATAEVLLREGAALVAQYGRDRAGADAAAGGGDALLIQADFHDPAAIDRLWREALAWQGRIDVLVNNAAIMHTYAGFDAAEDDWDTVWAETMAVNVVAPARLTRHAVNHFRKVGGGTLVTVSSWAGERGSGNPDMVAYAASKAAVKAMAQTVAKGFAKDNVLSYIVAPGVVRTRMSEDFAKLQGGEEKVTATLAMGEWVPPGDVAECIAFLASGRARHLTGATLDVNGASYMR